MPIPEPGIYTLWRGAIRRPEAVSEPAAEGIPERWLQQIWRHQRLDREALVTDDGRRVRVLHPGFWNRGAGPDFHDAVIAFDGSPAVQGGIEVDLVPRGWHSHGHDRNPAFRGVVLQVVWNGSAPEGSPPILRLEHRLDTPLEVLGPWLDEEAPNLLPNLIVGRCSAPLRTLARESVAELLRQAADVRLGRKAEEFTARAGVVGWDRALWEGVFAALGYRGNVWPMRRIAEVLAIDGTPGGSGLESWQARLFGVAGMLEPIPGQRDSDRIRELWHSWWRDRDALADSVLPRFSWRLSGVRPSNHPQRRLALAAHWIARGRLAAELDGWIRDDRPVRGAWQRLQTALEPAPDPYWSHHWTLRTAAFEPVRPLLGASRFTDLSMNVFLPWLRARAVAAGEAVVLQSVADRYHGWPRGEDNAVLGLARQRLAGAGAASLPRTAAAQQGLMQIARDFCARSDSLCAACGFPDLVRRIGALS
jgi:hypothetical protein